MLLPVLLPPPLGMLPLGAEPLAAEAADDDVVVDVEDEVEVEMTLEDVVVPDKDSMSLG